MNKAIFLDKDGTLIQDVAYNVNPDLIRLLPGVGAALRRLQEAGFLLIIVSNQPGIALGHFSVKELNRAVIHLYELLAAEGAWPAAFYFCPHAPVEKAALSPYPCKCRKPHPGLLHKAANDFDISLTRSWMIGDILHDVEAGKRAGCRTILLDNGNETEWVLNEYREPDYILTDMEDAAQMILEKERNAISRL